MKKIGLYSLLTVASLSLYPLHSHAQVQKPSLRFDENGEFKIVQFTDAHVTMNRPGQFKKTVARLNTIIEVEQPDLVIFTGDVVTGRPAAEAWHTILRPLATTNTPFVVVMGNHDLEQDLSRKEIAQLIAPYPTSLNTMTENRLDDIAIEVMSHKNEGKVASVLYCMDSGDYSPLKDVKKYAWLSHEQVSWYRETSAGYTQLNNNKPIPSYAFFHIPLPEYGQAYKEKQSSAVGVRKEDENSGKLNTGMFAAMKEMGDVQGVFVGHDHDNNYIIPYYGIALCYGHFSGDDTTYNHLPHGVRVIVLHEKEKNFESYIRYDDNNIEHHVIFNPQKSKIKTIKHKKEKK